MTPNHLVALHRYAEAAAILEERLARRPGDLAAIAGLPEANLCLARYPKALDLYRRADAREHRDMKKVHARGYFYLAHIGAILWLMGRRMEAIETFRFGAEGIADGSIEFGDLAGGASHGLLLWYAGVTAKEEGARSYALEFLASRAKRDLIRELWPGPIVLFVLGHASRDDVLEACCGTRDIEDATTLACGDLLKRRWLVQAVFYFAVQARSGGDEASCSREMRRCFGIENPILEVEWYLARGEVEGRTGRSEPAQRKRRGRSQGP
jgi:tetratricopeptide (TPR) repeat protein